MRTLPFLLSFTLLALSSEAARWHVDINANGAANGTNWADAFTDLQDGIAAAIPGDEIWVAQGVYKPTAGSSRAVSFVLPSGVGIYGGFAGWETELGERDITANPTILSGDIGQPGVATDNSFVVVYASNVGSTTRFDGFTVISSYKTSALGGEGGGFKNNNGSPTVANCTFSFNHAASNGPGIRHNGGTLTVLNCLVTMNTCNGRGAGVANFGGTINIIGCNISQNQSAGGSGAIYLDAGVCNIDRCVISGNLASGQGTIVGDNNALLNMYNTLVVGNRANTLPVTFMYSTNNSPHRIVNCTIAHNYAVNSSSSYINLNSASTVSNCIVYGNTGEQFSPILPPGSVTDCIVQGGVPTGQNIIDADPQFVQPGLLLLNPFDASDYDYRVGVMSPAIDAGNDGELLPIYTSDLDGNPRVHGAAVDIGAYELDYCPLEVDIDADGPLSICTGESVVLTASAGSQFIWSDGQGTASVTVSQGGAHTVTAVDDEGCRGSASVSVSLLSAAVQISGQNYFCADGTTTLSASGNHPDYLWSTGSQGSSITVAQAGTYTVSATAANGCTANASINVSERPNPTPSISFNGTFLATGNASSYQWMLNGSPVSGATGATHTPTSNGVYTVQVTDNFGCSGMSEPYNLQNLSVGEGAAGLVSISPNPVSDQLHLHTGAGAQWDWRIMDMTGRVCLFGRFSDDRQVLPTEGLQAGSYVIALTDNEARSAVLRFVKL